MRRKADEVPRVAGRCREEKQALEQQRRVAVEASRKQAKSDVLSRLELKIASIESSYDSKVAQAELNRAELLKLARERRLKIDTRVAQLVEQREVLARLDDERLAQLHAALLLRLAAAAAKRSARLAARKQRAGALFVKSRQVAHSVWLQRAVDRSNRRERWETKVEGARRRRADILTQRKGHMRAAYHQARRHAGERISRQLARYAMANMWQVHGLEGTELPPLLRQVLATVSGFKQHHLLAGRSLPGLPAQRQLSEAAEFRGADSALHSPLHSESHRGASPPAANSPRADISTG